MTPLYAGTQLGGLPELRDALTPLGTVNGHRVAARRLGRRRVRVRLPRRAHGRLKVVVRARSRTGRRLTAVRYRRAGCTSVRR